MKAIIKSKIFQTILSIHKVAYALWPDYKKLIDQGLLSISDYSKQIGLGVDGMQHLINAASHSIGAVAGVMGWDYDGFNGEYYERVRSVMSQISIKAHSISEDPIGFLEQRSYQTCYEDRNYTKTRFDGILEEINQSTDTTRVALEEIGKVTSDLNQFASNMPQFIKDNLPPSLLNSIAEADRLIHDKLIPTIDDLSEKVLEIDNILPSYHRKLTGLTEKMTKPGDILLGVDDLPEYARDKQLKAIDDVTCREYQKQVDKDNVVRDDKMKALESIREALTAPTAYPDFLGLETPRPPEISGIVVEPHETWFVGDY